MPEDEKNSWIKDLFGFNGHAEPPEPGGGFQPMDKAIATALVWCVAGVLTLRFRNPELGFLLGALAVAATIGIWKYRR